jgi:tetratricopeptide (TPR) repeat protein
MMTDGVFLVSWTLQAEGDISGWLVVEARGGYNLELDARPVDRRRYCGSVDPGTNWYRLRMKRGVHRLRLEVASPDGPQVRVNLLDDHGHPLPGVARVEGSAAGWADSEITMALPPASESLARGLEDDDVSVADLLLAAQLSRSRNDPEAEYDYVERARDAEPENPWAALALARHHFTSENGTSGSDRARNITQLLREANAIPGSQLFERAMAMQDGRREDAERILDELIADYPDDSRVLRVWVRETVRRGWVREAEEGLEQLESELPGSLAVTDLQLDVLASLERWKDRGTLLRALAAATPVETRWIGRMASSCLIGEAVTATASLLPEVDDPDLDVQLIQLYLENGDYETAREELGRARDQWGELRIFDELGLLLAGGDRQAVNAALSAAIQRDPSNLQLLTLSWRNGHEPFFEPFAVDAREFIREHRGFGSDVDAVLLLDQAVERIFSDGSSLYYYHGLTRANTPVGARRASMLQPLPDAYLLNLKILKPDGRAVVPADIQPGQGRIVLSDVEPGDVVEEEYVAWVGPTGASRDGHLPPYIYRFADPDRAFGLSEYVLLVPPDIDIQVDGNFEGLERSEKDWQGLRMLYWRAEKVPPMPTEAFAPPAQTLMPWLNYGFGVSWEDVGDAVRDRVMDVVRSSPELREWSREVFVGESSLERFQSLVDALNERVERGDSELSVGETAAQSFNRRRGNRLGIIATVLAEAGWDVDLVLTRPWSDRDQRLQVPTLDAFPVALLRATFDGEEIWFDSREDRRGVNHVHPLFQGSDGLVLPVTRAHLPVSRIETLPTFANPDLVEELTVHAAVDADGLARIAFTMPLRGGQAGQLLERVASVPQDQVGMVYRQIALALFSGADQVSGDIEETTGGATIHLDITVPGACDAEGHEMVCRSLILANPLVPTLARLPERTYPLMLRLPIERRIELELTPPSGWRTEPRRPRRLETRWGSVGETLADAENSNRSVLRIALPAQTVSPEEYRDFARFCQAVDELTTRPPRLERIETPPPAQ